MGGSGVQGLWESGNSAIATDSTSECSGWASVVFWARGSHGSEALGHTLSELPSSGVVSNVVVPAMQYPYLEDHGT